MSAACRTSAALPIIAGAGFPAAVVALGATPCAATIFPKHPHVEGGVAAELEVQGAPTAQAMRAGKPLPTAGHCQAPGCGDLQ